MSERKYSNNSENWLENSLRKFPEYSSKSPRDQGKFADKLIKFLFSDLLSRNGMNSEKDYDTKLSINKRACDFKIYSGRAWNFLIFCLSHRKQKHKNRKLIQESVKNKLLAEKINK